MSQENVEIARRMLDVWNRHDIQAILAVTDPEAEYVNAPTAVEPGTRRGHDEIVVVGYPVWRSASNRLRIATTSS
jgi:ketosteroid isomerase-like protein